MGNSVSEKMAIPRYSQSILRASTESIPQTNICILTATLSGGQATKIILPMPTNIGSNTNAAWENADVGLASQVAQGKPILETVEGILSSGASEMDRRAIEMMVNGILGDGADRMYQKRVGGLINPAKENYFRGSDCRNINMVFNLIPLSEADTKTYKEIIKNLQKYSVPSVPGGNAGRIMLYPASWNIRFEPGGFLPKYKEAVLTNISADYSGAGRTYLHHDGGPTMINLSLNFTELTILTREDIDDERSFG